MPRAILAADPAAVSDVLLPDDLALLREAYAVDPTRFVTDWATVPDAELAEVEVVVSGWGCPLIDAEVLARMPRLRAVCHAAGTVRFTVTREVLERGVVVTSAAAANALPVAEYTLATILLAAKRTPQAAARYRQLRTWDPTAPGIGETATTGMYTTVIGIISASLIGRRVLELLRPFDLVPLLYDPFVTPDQAAAMGAELVGLDELMHRSTVVSLHTPDLPTTRGMITRELLESMHPGSTFINTARPLIVDQDALREVLGRGEIYAVLDVTWPEPLPPDDVLWDMPNVVLTPHWAGSAGNEQQRLGRTAIDEALRIGRGEPPRHLVDLDRWDVTA